MTIYEELKALENEKSIWKNKYETITKKLPPSCKHNVKDAFIDASKCPKCVCEFYFFLIDRGFPIPSYPFWNEQKNKELIEKEQKRRDREQQREIIAAEKEAERLAEEHRKQEIRDRIIEEQKKLRDKYGYEIAKYISERYQSSEELGKRYERFVGYLYEKIGYKVEYNGIKMGKNDGGIDIIAKAKNHTVIVQCKRRGKTNFIHESTIDQLWGSFDKYRKRNPGILFECVLYTQNNNLDDAARDVLKLHSENMTHIVEPYPFDVGKEYPLIKCNIGKDNEKIYHLPNDAMYDRIKIEIKKGEHYVYTEQEAQNLGFRRTKQ
ncbi:restriction endonuclease [Sulfuricurvum sp.]|uniref:restriction endonuclease n=1 Tax=Sulfuricurvum sp. TaxID=2025608 RepID=UPI0026308B40|nr:restriction endonuclease [Sulfuricurvum sp.]MDD2267633.1 restriction endonuclease [Sulfuricurvum sp.]MDD2784975.1 restriction endonuclease [Sulfuricurvum sp.]